MDAPLDLADIRREIDALDGDLRALLLKRSDLVAQVAASKAQSGDGAILRPDREAAQMAALLDWQASHAAHLSQAGVLAIWREIIGMAIAQQGGLTIFTTAQAALAARGYFGASLSYQTLPQADAVLAQAHSDKAAVAVLAIDEARPPLDGQAVFARLPLGRAAGAQAAALVYGAADLAPQADSSYLVARPAPQTGDTPLAHLGDVVLVETDMPGTDDVWGQYRKLGEPS
ncbi:MAG: chorismate mutase [Parvibaculales bacterium]